MATWKERGEVRDSEDEEIWDSQSIDGEERTSRVSKTPGIDNFSSNLLDANLADYKVESREEVVAAEVHIHDDVGPHAGEVNSGIDIKSQYEYSAKNNVYGPSGHLTRSSPELEFSRGDIDPNDQAFEFGDEGNDGRPREDFPDTLSQPEEEISKSYVEITASTSSELSSPPESPQLSAIERELFPTLREDAVLKRREDSSTGLGSHVEFGSFVPQESAYAPTRYLRQRNPIQLHPYILEQERYRQTLKAGGLKPLTFTQGSHHSQQSRSAGSDNFEIDNVETEDHVAEAESPPDFNWDSLPSSSIGPPEMHHSNAGLGNIEADDDFEFPDLEELLQNPPPAGLVMSAANRRSKPRSKPSNKKFKKPVFTESRTRKTRADLDIGRLRDIFEIPASPPRTSSPFSTLFPRLHTAKSRSGTASPSLLSRSVDLTSPPLNLPTPSTTSAIKSFKDIDPNDVDLNRDPFATETPLLSSASSSDESVEIRKVGRKIKGVLPASHLRLAQPKQARAKVRLEKHKSGASPAQGTYRRGIAIPKASNTRRSTPIQPPPEILLFSDDSDDGDDRIKENNHRPRIDAHFEDESLAYSMTGYAEEDDSIDEMLPTTQRSRPSDLRPRKKRRTFYKSSSSKDLGLYARQPKITEHLGRVDNAETNENRPSKRRKFDRKLPVESRSRESNGSLNVGILDVIEETGTLPRFIRIAARTARSRSTHGRHSPSRKFIRLANRNDTLEAQSVLDNWRSGSIKQKEPKTKPNRVKSSDRRPLQQIHSNIQARLPLSSLSRSLPDVLRTQDMTAPRRLAISKAKKNKTGESATLQETGRLERGAEKEPLASPAPVKAQKKDFQRLSYSARPAQLETSELDYGTHYHSATFTGTKRILDTLLRSGRKQPLERRSMQLDRFLSDGSSLPNQHPFSGSLEEPERVSSPVDRDKLLPRSLRERKRPPRRIDVGASLYRQPSEPLITEYLKPIQSDHATGNKTKLSGLSDFGIKYPRHFDILPIPSGTFFHECTFIGSGRLAAAIKGQNSSNPYSARPLFFFHLKGRELEWGPWNESTSTEVGLCFDWLLDQFDDAQPRQASSRESIDLMISICDYLQTYLYFTDPYDPPSFASRMIDILQEVINHPRINSCDANDVILQSIIETLMLCVIILFQVLRISQAQKIDQLMICRLEELLLKACGLCTGLLFSHSLEDIRKMYDDLQYLSIRESGLRTDRYACEGLVVIIQVLGAAGILNGSFWDVVNPWLMSVDCVSITDAQTMEHIWYSMFSLLPLFEFDSSGVVIPGLRKTKAVENWSIPQQIIKQVFAIYTADMRQSPSFNEYCAALFGRCHHLITEWGWWKCNILIGTLFDFFASQNLSNLRNEEVYASPLFLDELSGNPCLELESGDRCFHIFLKIVAVRIMYMRSINDTKGIRNLIPRLLPNHDRQYPKEEVIRQRDLASLRNHHDLLCTLFWAAPPDLRPSLGLIQGLVVPDRSHKEACLINLNSWTNLARFILSTTPTAEAFQPFVDWQNTFFNKLLEQYAGAEMELRRQAEDLSTVDRNLISETYLQQTIDLNRTNIKVSMLASLNAFRSVIHGCTTAEALFESGYHGKCK